MIAAGKGRKRFGMHILEDGILGAVAGKRAAQINNTDTGSQSLQEEMAFGFFFCMANAAAEQKDSLIYSLQAGLDHAFDYYMRELDTAVETASFARLRNLYELRDTPENEVIRAEDIAGCLEAAVWSLITTTTFKQAVLTASGLGGEKPDKIAVLTGSLAGLYYGAEDIPAEWIRWKPEAILRKELMDDLPFV